MNLKTLATAAAIALFGATASIAASVTVNGTDYNVTTISGTFADNQALLENQVWFGDAGLAEEFARAVHGIFDFVNEADGAYFAIELEGSLVTGDVLFAATDSTSPDPFILTAVASSALIYAVAEPVEAVPLPAGGLLLLSAFGGVATLNRRKNRAA